LALSLLLFLRIASQTFPYLFLFSMQLYLYKAIARLLFAFNKKGLALVSRLVAISAKKGLGIRFGKNHRSGDGSEPSPDCSKSLGLEKITSQVTVLNHHPTVLNHHTTQYNCTGSGYSSRT
jgi:hypothetical protein